MNIRCCLGIRDVEVSNRRGGDKGDLILGLGVTDVCLGNGTTRSSYECHDHTKKESAAGKRGSHVETARALVGSYSLLCTTSGLDRGSLTRWLSTLPRRFAKQRN